MSEEKYWNLMSRYLADDLSLDETEELLAWLDEDPARADLFKELQETWDKTKTYPSHFSVDTHKAWLKVKRSVSAVQKKEKQKTPLFFSLMQAAAIILLAVTAGLVFYTLYSSSKLIEVETLAGEKKEVVLPDGSRVWMNEYSAISYSANLTAEPLRKVKLHGEAFFEVKRNPGKPFVIETGKTQTQVLGTSFNVLQDKNGSVKVSVVTGKVSFKSENKPEQKLILLPGEEGVIVKEGYVNKSKYKNANFLYWKSQSLSFENASFAEVIRTVEESYHVKFYVKDPGLLDRRITTSFTHTPFSQVLDVFEALLDISIKKSGSVYVVELKQ